jgi:predicted phosphate transport protein (TIGR00153 family)
MPGLLRRILPHEDSFFDLFTELAENVHAAAGALVDLLINFTDVPAKVERIKAYEHKADDLTHALITRLNQSFITPFDREDIHDLSTAIDDVLDLIDAAASRMLMYHVDRVRPGVADLATTLLAATEQMAAAVRTLEKRDHILSYCIEINRLENESDRLCRTLIAELFDEEKDPVQIIKWKEIIEVIETAADKCEDVANVIESVTLKSS